MTMFKGQENIKLYQATEPPACGQKSADEEAAFYQTAVILSELGFKKT